MQLWNTSANWTAPLTRRAALRGAGAVLALPFLESWAASLAKAAGQPAKAVKPPLRMGIFTVTGGTVLESWKMKEAGPLAKLPSILKPLEFAKNDLLLVTGLSHGGESENLNGHENCAFKHLTGAAKVGKAAGRRYAGISVDQAAARVAGSETFLPSMEFGLSNHETQYSYRSVDEPVPYEDDPRLVFDRMFRGRKPVVPNWQRRASAAGSQAVRDSAPTGTYERSVVDAVTEEAKSLRGKLGIADRQKLDQYLDSVRSLESRVERLEARLRVEALDLKAPGPSKLVPFAPKSTLRGRLAYPARISFTRLLRRTQLCAPVSERFCSGARDDPKMGRASGDSRVTFFHEKRAKTFCFSLIVWSPRTSHWLLTLPPAS